MKVLQRAVWNTAGWRRPTGSSGEAGYPANNGFGHEEWNFAIDDAVDGDVPGAVVQAWGSDGTCVCAVPVPVPSCSR